MKLLIFFVVILFCGCTSVCNSYDWEKGQALCTQHNGVNRIYITGDRKLARCMDGSSFAIEFN